MLILASASAIRSKMLKDAGVEHWAMAAEIDEAAVKRRSFDPAAIAEELACAKAEDISARERSSWVAGSDSVVSVEGRRFGKPKSREEAAEHLRFFSGRSMILTSSVALARDGATAWSVTDQATLQVRKLSPAFIDSYLAVEWPEVGQSAGVFRMEGRGVQLFEWVDGSHFTILGMPLIPLLGALRERGVIAS